MVRPPRHRSRAALLALATGAFGTARAFADGPASPPAAMTYSASGGCPAREDFWRQVLRHSRGLPAKQLRPIHVAVLEDQGIALARVTFEDDRGTIGTRELSGANCAEAAAAAALVVALEIDAQVEALAPSEQPAKPPVAEHAPQRPPPLTLRPRPPPAPPPPRRDTLTDGRQADAARSAIVWKLGAGAVAEYAVAPDPLIGAGAFVGLGSRPASWDVNASLVFMRSGVAEKAGQSAEFALLGGRLSGCAFPILDLERSTLGPCVAAELASVQSSGNPTERFVPAENSTPWFAMGPLLRFRQAFAELRLELVAGPWFPIVGTRTFVYDQPSGEAPFHEVPAVGWTASAGFSLDLN